MHDPDDYKQLVWGRTSGDDIPVTLNSYEAHFCAALLDAFDQGFDALGPQVKDISLFLHARAIEATGAQVTENSDSIWERIASFTPPPPGGPRAQP